MDGKRESDGTRSEWVKEEKPVVEKTSAQSIIRVTIRSLFPAKMRYTGQVTGEPYEWAQAGSVVSVRIEDAPYLLSKKIGSTGCCGAGNGGNTLFELL